jgi:hypothetical protein
MLKCEVVLSMEQLGLGQHKATKPRSAGHSHQIKTISSNADVRQQLKTRYNMS